MPEIPERKVCIFTNFFSYDECYSLIRVTEDQIKMLLSHGYKPIVIVSESFTPGGAFADPRVDLRKIPNVTCHNEVKKDETFDKDVEMLATVLKDHLKDVEVCITQDIVYKPSELKYQMAARKIVKDLPKIVWLHWINSATPPITLNSLMGIFTDEYLNLMREPFPNSYYVFFNKISEDMIAANFHVDKKFVKTVHHPSDLDEVYGVVDNNLKEFIKKRDIYSADAICVYPIRLDRGKQVEYVIKIMAMVKEFAQEVRVIIVDFHSTGGDKVVYRDELKNLGIDWGLNPKELSFTSEFCSDWNYGVPHNVVLSLMRISNTFIMPSVSESYSLITQEAALNKNILVLNQDFPPFRDIFGNQAIFRKFSSNWDLLAGYDQAMGEGKHSTTSYGPANISKDERKHYEKKYHTETAGMIVNKLTSDINLSMSVRTRKLRNLDYIFKKELEPLLWITPSSSVMA